MLRSAEVGAQARPCTFLVIECFELFGKISAVYSFTFQSCRFHIDFARSQKPSQRRVHALLCLNLSGDFVDFALMESTCRSAVRVPTRYLPPQDPEAFHAGPRRFPAIGRPHGKRWRIQTD